jgi:hypothetical protein
MAALAEEDGVHIHGIAFITFFLGGIDDFGFVDVSVVGIAVSLGYF